MRKKQWCSGLLVAFLVSFSIPVRAQTPPLSPADWVQLLKNGTVEERIRAAQTLGELRAIEAIDALGEALNDPQPKVRYHVIRALGVLRDPRIEPYLGRALLDPDASNRREALRIVYAYYLGEDISAGWEQVLNVMLFRQLRFDRTPWKKADPEVVKAFRSWLSSNDRDLRRQAVEAAEHLWLYDLIPDLVHLLDERPSKALVIAAFRALGNLKACHHIKPLFPWIHHEDAEYVAAAVWALAQCAHEDPQVGQVLWDAYRQTRPPEFQRIYYRGLAQAGVKEAIPLFLEGLRSRSAEIRRWSAEGLGRAAAVHYTYELGVAYLREKDHTTRLAMDFALFLLGRKEHIVRLIAAVEHGSDEKELANSYLLEYPARLFPEIFRFFPDLKEETRVEILDIAARTDDEALLPYLKTFIDSEDEVLSVHAFEAYQQVRHAVQLRAAYQSARVK